MAADRDAHRKPAADPTWLAGTAAAGRAPRDVADTDPAGPAPAAGDGLAATATDAVRPESAVVRIRDRPAARRSAWRVAPLPAAPVAARSPCRSSAQRRRRLRDARRLEPPDAPGAPTAAAALPAAGPGTAAAALASSAVVPRSVDGSSAARYGHGPTAWPRSEPAPRLPVSVRHEAVQPVPVGAAVPPRRVPRERVLERVRAAAPAARPRALVPRPLAPGPSGRRASPSSPGAAAAVPARLASAAPEPFSPAAASCRPSEGVSRRRCRRRSAG